MKIKWQAVNDGVEFEVHSKAECSACDGGFAARDAVHAEENSTEHEGFGVSPSRHANCDWVEEPEQHWQERLGPAKPARELGCC